MQHSKVELRVGKIEVQVRHRGTVRATLAVVMVVEREEVLLSPRGLAESG